MSGDVIDFATVARVCEKGDNVAALGRMTQEGSSAIQFGPFLLDTRTWELRRLDRRVKIRPQACKALSLLVNRRGQIVTREELRQHLWASDTFVDFEHGLNFCIRQIRTALGETANTPGYLETIPRLGYRFTLESSADFRSLAVLPFENVSGDPGLEYLADGITESLIRQLAQLPDLQVIARSSVFRFKGRSNRPEVTGRRLGVGAILTGRVLQREETVSISADLLDVHSGLHLWGEQTIVFETTWFASSRRSPRRSREASRAGKPEVPGTNRPGRHE